MTHRVRFYFDFISPYAFLGERQLPELEARPDVEIEPVPILFAALLNRLGHKGPAEIPPKRVHLLKNVLRIAARRGIEVAPPPAHPFNPLLALRVAWAAPDAKRRAVIHRLFGFGWTEGGDLTRPEAVAGALSPELDGPALVEAANTPEVKVRLKEATEAALEGGVFGVPSYEVEGEVFWGQESLPDIEAFLDGRDPATPEKIAPWINMPAAARR